MEAENEGEKSGMKMENHRPMQGLVESKGLRLIQRTLLVVVVVVVNTGGCFVYF